VSCHRVASWPLHGQRSRSRLEPECSTQGRAPAVSATPRCSPRWESPCRPRAPESSCRVNPMAARSRSNPTHLLDHAGRAAECPVASAGKSQRDPSSVSIVSSPIVWCPAPIVRCRSNGPSARWRLPSGSGARPRRYLDCVTPSRCAGGYDRVFERRRAVALALHFRETEGLSIAQIAERIGRSPATIKAYFYDPSYANKRPTHSLTR